MTIRHLIEYCCCYGEVAAAVSGGADGHAFAVGKVAAPAAAMVKLLLQLLLDKLLLLLQLILLC
jgi:hypothetical protein